MKMSQHHAEQDDDLELCSWAEWEQTVGVEAMLEKWDRQRPQRSALQQLLAAEKAVNSTKQVTHEIPRKNYG